MSTTVRPTTQSFYANFIPDMSRDGIGKKLSFLALKLYSPAHYSSEKIVGPFFSIPDKNASYFKLDTITQIFAACVCVSLLIVTVPMALGAGLVETAANKISTTPYLTYKGNFPEKTPSKEKETTVETLNICSFWGVIPQAAGGVPPAHKRLDALCASIRTSDPDILLFQEVSYGPALGLYSRLKDNYANFFMNIGPNPWKNDSGLFVATKYPIVGKPRFIAFPGSYWMKRGVFCFETEQLRVYTSHFEPHDSKSRKEQLDIIKKDIRDNQTDKTIIIGGDLNILRTGQPNDEYSQLKIHEDFLDLDREKHPFISQDTATYIDLAEVRKNKGRVEDKHLEIDDYLLIKRGTVKGYKFETDRIEETFSLTDPSKTITDHRGLRLTITHPHSD